MHFNRLCPTCKRKLSTVFCISIDSIYKSPTCKDARYINPSGVDLCLKCMSKTNPSFLRPESSAFFMQHEMRIKPYLCDDCMKLFIEGKKLYDIE